MKTHVRIKTIFSRVRRIGLRHTLKLLPRLLFERIKLFPRLLFGRIILVFQMGKVGSRSVEASLLNLFVKQGILTRPKQYHYGPNLFRSEIAFCDNNLSFFRTHVASALEPTVRKTILWRAKLGLPLSVVCPIREPIARDVSAFFYFYLFHRIRNRVMSIKQIENTPLEELQRLFCEDPRPTNQHGSDQLSEHSFSTNWFDRCFKPLLNIDVYKRPFPVDRKWQTYHRGFTKVLLYRIDLERSEQLKLIASFLNLELNELIVANKSDKHIYANVYKKFNETAKLPEQYIRKVHGSRFAKHFWSPEELKSAADKWRIVSDS